MLLNKTETNLKPWNTRHSMVPNIRCIFRESDLTLKKDSSFHCISSFQWPLSCLYTAGLWPEVMEYSGVSYLFWDYTLRKYSSFHCISSFQWPLSCLHTAGLWPEMMEYSGVSYLFWECRSSSNSWMAQLLIISGKISLPGGGGTPPPYPYPPKGILTLLSQINTQYLLRF